MADDRIFNFNGPTTFNDIHDNHNCTIIVPSPTEESGNRGDKSRGRPRTAGPVPVIPAKPRELMTFSRRGILEEHVKLLYVQMVNDGWIMPETDVADFISLFSGERSECRVIWAGKYGKGTLVFLFQYLEENGLISFPKGYTLPNILMGHFVDKEGKFLTNLDNGDPANEKAGVEIMAFAATLKIRSDRTGRRADRIDHDDDEMGYGDGLNENDIESEGLKIHKR